MAAFTSDVSVLGLGHMGSGLARAFVDHDHRVGVWNRTAARAEPLVQRGAIAADSASAAIDASPVTVVCINTYDELRSLLEARDADLGGRTIVNLITGTPEQASAMQQTVEGLGGGYLDGHIHAYPRHVGTPEGMLAYSGSRALWDQHGPLLLSLGGASLHVGDDVDASNRLATAISIFFHVGLLAYFETVSFARAMSFSVEQIMPLIDHRLDLLKEDIGRMVPTIVSGEHDAGEASLGVHLAAMELFAETMKGYGQQGRLIDDVIAYLQQASDAGKGTLGISAVVDVMVERA
jgi:3-hydroxyisobutyrate dehydrogenase-like beta-hydroxyacid dehydrogenase